MPTDLDPEHEELLARLVEATRSVSRHRRAPFFYSRTYGGSTLVGDGLPKELTVSESDLKDLVEAGLLRREYGSRGTPTYEVRPQGFAYYDRMMQRQAGRVERVEDEVRRYLDAGAIPDAYQAAVAKWRRGDELLSSADTDDQHTTIGHICREAMQEFAKAMADRVNPPGADELPRDPSKTVARIRACLDHLKKRGAGKTEVDWLEALLAYWGTVSDLAQRQEHGAGKEGEELVWEDARRLVFHTALVMYELAQAAERRIS